MKEIPFSTPVSGAIKFDDESEGRGRGYREEGKALFDVILEGGTPKEAHHRDNCHSTKKEGGKIR